MGAAIWSASKLAFDDAAAEADVIMVKDDALAGRNGFDFFVEIDRVVFENGGERNKCTRR